MACSKVSLNFYYYDRMYLLSCHYPYTWIAHYLQVPEGQGQQLRHLTGIQHSVQWIVIPWHRLDSVDACKIYQQINQWMKGSFLLKILQVITSLTKWTCNPQRRKITLEREENTFITPVWTVKSLSGILILPTLTWWVILKRAVTMS